MQLRVAVGACLLSTQFALAQPLAAPFPVRMPDAKASNRPCEPAGPPVVRFALPSKYGQTSRDGQSGSSRDRIDADAEADFEEAMAPIKAFSQAVVKAANDYHRSGRVSAAACVLDQLAAWARVDALKGPESHTAWYKLATTVSGLSFAYMQVKPALGGRAADVAVVEGWLKQRGQDVAGYFEALKTPRSSRNNHRAWAGLAAASAAVASNDRALLVRGVSSFRIVACQATAEGALPLEIERGRKAAEYHLYTLAALAPLALIGERNGHALYKECDGALGRTVRFTLAALANTDHISGLAKAPQGDPRSFATPSRLVFLEPWLVHHPEAGETARSWLARRPLGLTDLGGNQTLLYGGAR